VSIDQRATKNLFAIPGIKVGAAKAGIRQTEREDVAVFDLTPGTRTAVVFTRNAFCAAPVILAKTNLINRQPRYLLVNSGNANAGTGPNGLSAARATVAALAAAGDCEEEEVLPFSTGVIGQALPVDRINNVIPVVLANMHQNGWSAAARAILTTDTRTKGWSARIDGLEASFTVTGIAKGSGMIRPNMATMLAFIATDLPWEQASLERAVKLAVDRTFNCISVDGDTSTNDACVVMATGRVPIAPVNHQDRRRFDFALEALERACSALALDIVRDGEGATKLVAVTVEGGTDAIECRTVAETVANSPLVKTAFFAQDPNWGRIVAAIGRAPVRDLDVEKVSVSLNDVRVFSEGGSPPDYRESAAASVMAADEFAVRIDLGRGSASATVYTCDLSYDYVRINAEYRS
jgi:glutamate N-acetyltransferase/amino-acid N-acetyltransferase